MHKHNLRVVLATRKWRVVSSHWLDADKAPDCTCRKSIGTIRIRASFLTNSSRGELVGVSLQTSGKKKKKTCCETNPHKHSYPVEWRIHFAFCCHSSHFVRVMEDQDTGARDMERAAAAALWEDKSSLAGHLEQKGDAEDAVKKESHSVLLFSVVLWIKTSTDAEDKLEVDIMLVLYVPLPACLPACVRIGSNQNVGGNQWSSGRRHASLQTIYRNKKQIIDNMESQSERWASTATPESAGGESSSILNRVRHVSTMGKKTTTLCHGGEQRGTDDVRRGRVLQGGLIHCTLHQRPPADMLVSWLSDQTCKGHGDALTIKTMNKWKRCKQEERKEMGGKEGWADLVNKMSQRWQEEVFLFFFVTSAFSKVPHGFLLASNPQQTTWVPQDLACDCLGEQQPDDCGTG